MPRGDWRPTHSSTLAAIEFLEQRWTLRLVWELDAGPLDLDTLAQRMAGCSIADLACRLDYLRTTRLVEISDGAYALTPTGSELARALDAVWCWASAWHPIVRQPI